METKLIPFVVAPDNPGHLPCWNFGRININQIDALKILGTPHYVENDSRAIAGGSEEHWSFLTCEKLPVFFRLRIPYEHMDLCLTRDVITTAEKTWLEAMFKEIKIQYYESPWDENTPSENAE